MPTDKQKKELRRITDNYGVYLMGVIGNIQGTFDVILDHNIYYKEQEKMVREIRETLPVNDIIYRDVA